MYLMYLDCFLETVALVCLVLCSRDAVRGGGDITHTKNAHFSFPFGSVSRTTTHRKDCAGKTCLDNTVLAPDLC